MRMRKLGKGQSVVFFATNEIHERILAITPKKETSKVSVQDVLHWVITETCADLRQSMPLWAVQGYRYERQRILWDAARCTDAYRLSEQEASDFLEEEAQSLQTRYSPSETHNTLAPIRFEGTNQSIQRILARCQKFECLSLGTASLQEEQERELSPEIEQERQIERPKPASALTHHIHDDVKTFVTTGTLRPGSAFIPAFSSLKHCSAATYLDPNEFPKDILVTEDFSRTVKCKGISDFYERPVQWILTRVDTESHVATNLVIISPFEAQELYDLIVLHRKVTLHVYSPRPNQQYVPIDNLNLYTEGAVFNPSSISQRLKILLNLFAGQLYIGSFEEYRELCGLLGLAWKATEENQIVQADGFIVPKHDSKGFQNSPVKFLKTLVTKIRRNCEGVEKTHIGRILDGDVLEHDAFD
jgi:hypothetical protein